MKYNAFQVCEELTCQIDGAIAPGGFMKAYTPDSAEDLFFKNHKSLKEFISKAGSGKPCPGQSYFHSLKTFMETHMETGEKKNLFEKGMLAKLTVHTLDKCLAHFNLKNTLRLRKAAKVQAIQSHLIATMDTGHRDDEIEYMEVEPQEQAMQEQYSDEDMNSETCDEDIVIRDMHPSDSSSESTDEEADSFDASSLFTTLTNGRVAVNPRAANYVS
eukprot:gene1811-2031_t